MSSTIRSRQEGVRNRATNVQTAARSAIWAAGTIAGLAYLFPHVACQPRATAETPTAPPLKYLSSCEIDLNADGETDLALLVETLRGLELIVLMATTNGYNAVLLSRGKPHSILECNYGWSVRETTTGRSKGRLFKTLGTYIELTQPEASAVAFFWTKDGFQEVWTSG